MHTSIDYGQGRVDLPPNLTEVKNTLSYPESLEQPLVDSFGTEITDVSNEARLHTLFAVQGAFLVEPMLDEVNEDTLSFAVRGLSRTYKHEKPFWSPDSDDTTTARVIFPYSPPVSYFYQDEYKANRQLHMTFGLKRPVSRDGETQSVRVAQATIYVIRDFQNPFYDSFKLQKSITRYQELKTVEEANSYLASGIRNANAAKTIIGILTDEL